MDALPSLLSEDRLEYSPRQEDSAERNNVSNLQEELEEFRQRWQQELQEAGQLRLNTGHGAAQNVEEKAKEFFLHGIQAEQEGALYEAIHHYRRAMQLVPDIESRIEFVPNKINRERQDSESTNDSRYCGPKEEIDEDLVKHFQNMTLKETTFCYPDYEQKGTHISCLPLEVLMYVFQWVVSIELDMRSLEMLSQVCRGFYLCARDEGLWKMVCLRIWGNNCGSFKKYAGWRKMYLERPHLLFNGCYISRATYVREGEQGLDQFYRPYHLVEYYRYIRFFPDGSILMMCSPEEPTVIVPKLRTATILPQGLLKGFYKLYGAKVVCVLTRVKSQDPGLRYKRQRQAANQNDIEQTYSVEFELTDAGRWRHRRLTWVSYSVSTVYKATGHESVADFELKSSLYPPLIFSHVLSYSAVTNAPLK